MTVHVEGSAIVRARTAVGDCVVWAVEHAAGIARVEDRNGLTEVVVADAPRSIEDRDASFLAAACTVDGGVFVIAHDAPPALLIHRSECRTAPAEPGGRELLTLAPDDLLLLVSSSVLEERPAALSKLLYEDDPRVKHDPVALLSDLFREVRRGAGVVIGRPTQPTVRSEG